MYIYIYIYIYIYLYIYIYTCIDIHTYIKSEHIFWATCAHRVTWLMYKRRDSFMRDMTHSWETWLIHKRHCTFVHIESHDSFRCVTWRVPVWYTLPGLPHSRKPQRGHALPQHVPVTWLIRMYDSFECVTWLIQICDIHIFDVTHLYVSRYSFGCVAWLILTGLACCGKPQSGHVLPAICEHEMISKSVELRRRVHPHLYM